MADEQPNLSENARLRLYELAGYPQGECLKHQLAEHELFDHGLIDEDGDITPRGTEVAENWLFHA